VGEVDDGHGVDHHLGMLAAWVQTGEGPVGAKARVVHQHVDLGGRGVRDDAADLFGLAEIGRHGANGHGVLGPQFIGQRGKAVGGAGDQHQAAAPCRELARELLT